MSSKLDICRTTRQVVEVSEHDCAVGTIEQLRSC